MGKYQIRLALLICLQGVLRAFACVLQHACTFCRIAEPLTAQARNHHENWRCMVLSNQAWHDLDITMTLPGIETSWGGEMENCCDLGLCIDYLVTVYSCMNTLSLLI